jgi:alcohol dehydrogenase (nicotinoprotein)
MRTRAAILRDELITRRYGLDEINQGYQDLDDGKIIRA